MKQSGSFPALSLLAAVCLQLCCISSTLAQPQLFFDRFLSENIRVERGLSQNTVYTLLQDTDGFLWMGTWDGLNKFDGYNFTTYNKENGLTNEAIRALYQHGDVIWVGTESGLNAISLKDGSVKQFFAQGDTASLSDNWINHITADHRGMLWISTARGLTELDPAHLTFRQVFSRDYGNPIRSNYFNMLVQDKNQNYWIATSHGLVFVDEKTLQVTRYFHSPSDSTSLPDNHVNCLLFDPQQRLWIGTKNGIALFDAETQRFTVPKNRIFETMEAPQKEILALFYENETLWIGTNGAGLLLYQPTTNMVQRNVNVPNRNFSLSDNRVFTVYRDRQGVIWVGSFNGLNRLNENAPRFRTYRNHPDYPNSLSNNSVWAFAEDVNTNIWIGTEDGISVLDRKSGSYSFMKHIAGNPNSLSGNQIRTIRADSLGNMWIGTRYNGLNHYNTKTKTFTRFRNNPRDGFSLPDDFVLSVATEKLPVVWVGTDKGLGKLNTKTGLFTNYLHQTGNPKSLPDNKIYDLLVDSKGRLWVCTADGLALYNELTNDFKVYRIPSLLDQNRLVIVNKFFSMREAGDGTFWIGTRSGGLVHFDADKESFKVFTDRDGLPNNVTYMALEDLRGDIWVTTNWGLTRFSTAGKVFTNYEVSDGLQSNEFNFNAGLRASNGELFFGGMNGFNAFFPEEIKVNQLAPVIQITSFKLFGKPQTKKLNKGDTIVLKYDDNVFSFEFAALDFSNPTKIKYRYMLTAYDESWIDRDANQRYAEYAKVSPGTYTFKVIASNSDGFWNEEGVEVHLLIRSPWYGTWLFRLLVMLTLVLLVYLIVFLRMRSVRKTHEVELKYLDLEKQLFALEQKALQLQMNPHFLFNSLNSIQSFIVNNDINNAIYYLSKFSQLMRRTLANSRESYVPLRDEMQALQLYVEIEKLRFNDKFEYQITIDPEIDEGFVEIPPMIIQPYVENAIIHGLMHKTEKGNLIIDLRLEGDNILFTIEDNGVGRERAAEIRRESGIERKSRGMMITGERLEILNQYTKDTYTVNVVDLFDEKGQAAGTRVLITIHANVN